MASVGFPITRRAWPKPNTPAGGAASSAVTITGTMDPVGSFIEWAWGSGTHTPPATGWTAALADANGNWSVATTRPASAGTYHLWARSQRWPRSAAPAGAMVVT